jgi:hypothetical protein
MLVRHLERADSSEALLTNARIVSGASVSAIAPGSVMSRQPNAVGKL